VDVGRREREGAADAIVRLFATFATGPASASRATLEDEGRRRLASLRERDFDLGIASGRDADARVDAIHAHARRALYAAVRESEVRDVCDAPVRARTRAADRDDYLSHPWAGERLDDEGVRSVAAAYRSRP